MGELEPMTVGLKPERLDLRDTIETLLVYLIFQGQ
jgi:hypothetical protein